MALFSVHAFAEGNGSQLHTRMGYFHAGYSLQGVTQTSVSLMSAFDLEYEMFSEMRGSYTFRTIIGYNFGKSMMDYNYIGLGRRYYLWSDGQPLAVSEGATQISTMPKLRYYVGGDLGISRIVLEPRGTTAEVASSLIDFGGHFGSIYQISPNLGLEAHAGLSYGWGFSRVAAGTVIMKFFLGTSFFF